jgi:hypothetical protein
MAKSIAVQAVSRDCPDRSHESHDSSEGKAVALSRSPRAQGVAFSAAGTDMGRDFYRGMGKVPSHENGPNPDASRACARAGEWPELPASRTHARTSPADHLAYFKQVKAITGAKLKARKSGRGPCEGTRKSDGMPCQAKSEPAKRFCRVHGRSGVTR